MKGEKRMKNRKKGFIGIVILGMLITFLLCTGLSYDENQKGGEEKKEETTGEEKSYENPQILCPEPDGENGWFQTKPQIQIIHTERQAIVWYELKSASGKTIEGQLKIEKTEEEGSVEETEKEEMFVVPKEFLEEGENLISVWMTETETKEELYREEITVKIDETMPAPPVFSYPFTDDGTICVNTEFEIEVKSEDAVSGISEIVVLHNEMEIGRIQGGEGSVTISPPFYGAVDAYAVDRAGNRSAGSRSAEVLCENEAPLLWITTADTQNGWYAEAAEVAVQIQEPAYEGYSGLKRVCCYVNDRIVTVKEYEREQVTQDNIFLRIEENSVSGEPVQIAIEAEDYAGNKTVQSQELYIDGQIPVIEAEGIYQSMITAETKTAVFTVGDENILENCNIEVWRTSPAGDRLEETDKRNIIWEETEGERKARLVFEEEGKYDCVVTASDKARHISTAEYTFIIDKTSPIIRYVSQMEGVYIPYFEWNYGAEEMIQDFIGYTYQIYLDGVPYFAGKRVIDEGVRILQVTAEDEAGNEADAYAVFTIDHTAPEICWRGVEDGANYEGEADFSIWVEEEGGRLHRLEINGEKQNISADSRIVRYEFCEPGAYYVTAEAEDLAGNKSRAEIQFSIVEQMSAAEHIEKVFSNKGRGTEERERKDEIVWIPAILFAGVLLASVGRLCYRKKRRHRKKEL